MSSIIDRYFIRQVCFTTFGVIFVLMLILLSRGFALLLNKAADGKLPGDTVFMLMGLTSLEYFIYPVVPVALFLGLLLVIGRMYSDSEMAAIYGCGIGLGRIYRPLLMIAFVAAALLGWLSLDLGPKAAHYAGKMREAARQEASLGLLEEGRFKKLGKDKGVVFVEKIATNGELQNVFIHGRQDGVVNVIRARRGVHDKDAATGERSLKLYDGVRYEGNPGDVNYRWIEFEEHGVQIHIKEVPFQTGKRKVRSTESLLGSDHPKDIAELQRRISIPLTAIMLTLLAVPLGRTQPRRGRYGKLVLGVLLFMLYYSLLEVVLGQMGKERWSLLIGVWPIHLAMLGLIFALIAQQTGWSWLLMPWRYRHIKRPPAGAAT